MQLAWDIRKTLDVHPTPSEPFNCVGFAPSKGRRCQNPINISNRGTASRMLDRMDRSESVSDITRDLRELASLLLCIRNHQSQVEKFYNKWQRLIAEEYLRVKQKEKEDEKEERREIVKLKNELAKMKSIATQAKNELEEDELSMPHQTSVSSKTSIFNSGVSINDPFEAQASSLARPNIFTRPSPQSDTRNTDIVPSEDPATLNKKSFVPEGKRAAHSGGMPYMPSPSTHEPSSRTKEPRIAIAEHHGIGTAILNDSNTITMSKFTVAFESKSASTIPAFHFENPTKAKITQVEAAQSSSLRNVLAFSGSFRTSKPPTAPISEAKKAPEEQKRIPLQKKTASPMNVALSNIFGPSTYECESQDITPLTTFEFEVPVKPQQPSAITDSTAYPGLLFKVTQPEDDDSETTITPPQHSKQPEEPDVPPYTPAKDIPIPAARPATPLPKEESFGYANITPDSIRYTTYLPARKQYGIITPPETPEMLVRALSKSTNDSSYFGEEMPREIGLPVPRVARNQLPASTPPRMDGEREACAGCGSRADLGVEKSRCDKVGDEVEVRAGCLAKFGFRRLKEKVSGKLKIVKGRAPTGKRKDFSDSRNVIALE